MKSGRTRKWTEEQQAEAEHMRGEGKTLSAIARRLGVGETTIRRYLKGIGKRRKSPVLSVRRKKEAAPHEPVPTLGDTDVSVLVSVPVLTICNHTDPIFVSVSVPRLKFMEGQP